MIQFRKNQFLLLKCTAWVLMIIGLIVTSTPSTKAGPNEQAEWMHRRLTGSANPAKQSQMASLIQQGRAQEAAMMAMDDANFLYALMPLFKPSFNREATDDVPLGDGVATIIGFIRDGKDMRDILRSDITYTGRGNGLPAYSQSNNNHYQQIEEKGVDINSSANFAETQQSALPESPFANNASYTAGIITSREYLQGHAILGTNRRMTEFLFKDFMCRPFEAIMDTSRPSHYIRQDPLRAPGNDVEIFHTTCLGCHAGQDALGGAFASLDWDEENSRSIATIGQVRPKFSINTGNFKAGKITTDDSWTNLWRQGPNSALGWRNTFNDQYGVSIDPTFGYSYGKGPRSLGSEIASSRSFTSCLVKKAMKFVCLKSEESQLSQSDRIKINEISAYAEENGMKYKDIFARVTEHCLPTI